MPTRKDKSGWLPSQSFSQAMSILSFREDTGLEPFIERLTKGQTADISKTFEIYHNTGRLKGGAAKAAQVQFAKSSDAESEGEGNEPPYSGVGEDSEDGESHNLFKALTAQQRETESRYLLTGEKGQGKCAQSAKGPRSRKKSQTDPKGNITKASEGGKKAKASSTNS